MKLSDRAWSVTPFQLRAPEGDATGGGAGGGGGTGDGQSNKGDEVVPLKTHKETLEKFHNTNKELNTVKSEMEKLKADLKAAQTQKSQESGDYKKLYEETKTEKEQIQTKYEGLKTNVFNNERLRALTTELKKLGLKDNNDGVMDFAALDEMPVETTSQGRILVQGADLQAKKLKEKYGFAFETPKAPHINNGGAGGGKGGSGEPQDDGTDIADEQLTPAFMVELQKKDRAKYMKVFPRFQKKMALERQQ